MGGECNDGKKSNDSQETNPIVHVYRLHGFQWLFPKNYFPLPSIDRLLDATMGCELLTCLNALSGYNQIYMHSTDQDNTTCGEDDGILYGQHACEEQKRKPACGRIN